MLLTACLIIKNEELLLDRCLRSLKGIADEIIIADTGSTDRSLEIAKNHEAHIIHYTWDGNFSNARNKAIEAAQGTYILTIDADEYFKEEDQIEIRTFLEANSADGYLVQIVNYLGSVNKLTKTSPIQSVRIFKQKHRYTGSIHEQIDLGTNHEFHNIMFSPITIHHVGYISEFVAHKRKPERNMAMLKEQLDQTRSDPFHLVNMIVEYARIGDFKNVLPLYEETYDLVKDLSADALPLYLPRLFNISSLAASELKDWDRAIMIAEQGVTRFPYIAELYRKMAIAYMGKGNYQKAIQVLKECKRVGEPKLSFVDTLEGMSTFYSSFDMGMCYMHLGDPVTAQKWYLQSFLENPSFDTVIPYLLSLMPANEDFLKTNIESRIQDALCLSIYAESYALFRLPGAENVIERIAARVGKTEWIQRGMWFTDCEDKYTLLRSAYANSDDEMTRVINAIIHVVEGREEVGYSLLDHTSRGRNLAAWIRTPSQGGLLSGVIKDLIAARAYPLIALLFPYAEDADHFYGWFRHTSRKDIFKGCRPLQEHSLWLEWDALSSFQKGHFPLVEALIVKSLETPVTISKIALECDLLLQKNQTEKALKHVEDGLTLFPDSQLLQNISKQLGQMIQIKKGELFMNRIASYQTQSVMTTPLHVQLSQLHEKAAILVRGIHTDALNHQVMEARAKIEQLQEIISFLRSSLDLTLEAAQKTDQTYAYFYRLSINWYMQPNIIDEQSEERASAIEFWESWAKTWAQVKE